MSRPTVTEIRDSQKAGIDRLQGLRQKFLVATPLEQQELTPLMDALKVDIRRHDDLLRDISGPAR